mgnify:CR=1 FL=1
MCWYLETSGLSSKLKLKPASSQPIQEETDPNEKRYTFYLDVTIADKIEVPKVEILVPITTSVSGAISMALLRFKMELEAQGVIVNNNINLYNARLSKKNGKAKTDMPCKIVIIQLWTEIKYYLKLKSVLWVFR